LGRAIVEAQTLQYMEQVPFGLTQTRLGNEIVAATRTTEARAALMPYLQEEARESLMRMQGMIQETAGHAVVAATQRMWRAGMTDMAKREFPGRLGQVRAAMMLEETAATPRREEALGWTVVGRLLALEQLSGHTQERLGSAVRDAGVLSAMVER